MFTFILQNGIVKIETQEVFTTAINDVESDIREKSKAQLLSIAENVKQEDESNPNISLQALAEKHDIVEINVVNQDGLITNSNKGTSAGKREMLWLVPPELKKPSFKSNSFQSPSAACAVITNHEDKVWEEWSSGNR